jgi:hypothetical protein
MARVIKDWIEDTKVALVNSQKSALVSRNTILETAHDNCGNCGNGAAVIVRQVEKRGKAASDAVKAANKGCSARHQEIDLSLDDLARRDARGQRSLVRSGLSAPARGLGYIPPTCVRCTPCISPRFSISSRSRSIAWRWMASSRSYAWLRYATALSMPQDMDFRISRSPIFSPQ